MEYKDLATLYHMDSSPLREANIKVLLDERKNNASSYDTGFSTPSGSLFLAVPRELNDLTQKVLRRERKVSNLFKALPGLAAQEVLRSLVVNEVVMSNSIENIHSTKKEIEEALNSKEENPALKRFREFAKLYIDLSCSDYALPKTPQDIRSIYDRIMQGETLECLPDGDFFRKDTVCVTDGIKSIHAGLSPEAAIIEAIQKMLDLVNSDTIPEFYSALISHYIFEYIHPFYDGNGRTGRYLLSMFLEVPLSKPTALSLSRVMAENKLKYYQAFRSVENPLNHGELTFFVMTMHELILQAQDNLIEDLERNLETFEQLQSTMLLLEKGGRFAGKGLKIIFVLAQQAAFGISSAMSLQEISQHIDLGAQQTRKYLSGMMENEIVQKVRGRDPITFALTESFLNETFPALSLQTHS